MKVESNALSEKAAETHTGTPANTRKAVPAVMAGMQPAFRHRRTGELHLSQTETGVPAPEYGFAGLPEDWVVERDVNGNAVALHPDIIAGYWRDARFIALSQLASMPLDG